MKKILVGIDFSESSMNTLEHAISLANKFRSNLILLWIENKKSISHLELNKGDNIHDKVNEKFDSILNSAHINIAADRVTVQITKGESSDEIISFAKSENVDLLIVGTHGFHGFKRYLTGSNANKVIAGAPCPVITIRPNRDIGRELDVVVIPIDSGVDTRQKLPLATKIARLYGAEVHILGLHFSDINSIKKKVISYAEQSKAYVLKNGIQKVVVHYVASTDGARTILNYAVKVNAGLIAVMIEAELGGSAWSLQSQGKQFVNQSPIPILNIANKELIRTAPKL